MKQKIFSISAMLAFAFINPLSAATVTFVGDGDGSGQETGLFLTTGSNYVGGVAPTAADDVVVGNGSVNNDHMVVNSASTINSLTVNNPYVFSDAGANLNVTGNVNISGNSAGIEWIMSGNRDFNWGGTFTVGTGSGTPTLSLVAASGNATLNGGDFSTLSGANVRYRLFGGIADGFTFMQANTVNIGTGSTLNVIFETGYSYVAGTSYKLIDGASLTGSFASTSITYTSPNGIYTGIVTRDGSNGDYILTVVPEPSTYALIGIGFLFSFRFKRAVIS